MFEHYPDEVSDKVRTMFGQEEMMSGENTREVTSPSIDEQLRRLARTQSELKVDLDEQVARQFRKLEIAIMESQAKCKAMSEDEQDMVKKSAELVHGHMEANATLNRHLMERVTRLEERLAGLAETVHRHHGPVDICVRSGHRGQVQLDGFDHPPSPRTVARWSRTRNPQRYSAQAKLHADPADVDP